MKICFLLYYHLLFFSFIIYPENEDPIPYENEISNTCENEMCIASENEIHVS